MYGVRKKGALTESKEEEVQQYEECIPAQAFQLCQMTRSSSTQGITVTGHIPKTMQANFASWQRSISGASADPAK